MKGKLNVYYDAEGDFLEISIGKPTKCIAEEVEPGVFIRYDIDTGEARSVGILNFKERGKNIAEIMSRIPIKASFEVG